MNYSFVPTFLNVLTDMFYKHISWFDSDLDFRCQIAQRVDDYSAKILMLVPSGSIARNVGSATYFRVPNIFSMIFFLKRFFLPSKVATVKGRSHCQKEECAMKIWGAGKGFHRLCSYSPHPVWETKFETENVEMFSIRDEDCMMTRL